MHNMTSQSSPRLNSLDRSKICQSVYGTLRLAVASNAWCCHRPALEERGPATLKIGGSASDLVSDFATREQLAWHVRESEAKVIQLDTPPQNRSRCLLEQPSMA